MNFIDSIKKYPVLFMIAGFVAFVIIWFAVRTPEVEEAAWTANPAHAGIAQASSSGDDFEPDGTNVNPNTHSQLESLRKRVVDTPDDTTHIFRLARLLQDSHKPDEAARNYRHYLALHPDNYQAWLDMTQSFGQAQQWDDALKAVEDMLKKYPEDASALYNKGAIYANLNRYDEAEQVLQVVIEQNKSPEVTALAEMMVKKLEAL